MAKSRKIISDKHFSVKLREERKGYRKIKAALCHAWSMPWAAGHASGPVLPCVISYAQAVAYVCQSVAGKEQVGDDEFS